MLFRTVPDLGLEWRKGDGMKGEGVLTALPCSCTALETKELGNVYPSRPTPLSLTTEVMLLARGGVQSLLVCVPS